MNHIKNNIIKILVGILIFTSFSSCDEGGKPDPGMTTTGNYAGDWFIKAVDSDGADVFDYKLHSTYNTSANDNTMWLDDHENGYYIKAKYSINTANGQFFATDATNVDDGGDGTSTVTITEGQITKFGTFSKAGHPVDKIHFRVHYSYDAPGYDIIYDGHRRTGFLEDEY
jgi:hypothetical protein